MRPPEEAELSMTDAATAVAAENNPPPPPTEIIPPPSMEGAPDEEAAVEQAIARGVDGLVQIGDRYEVLTNASAVMTDATNQQTYLARRIGQSQPHAFAIVTGTRPVARSEILSGLRTVENPGLLQLVDWGVVNWPLERRQRLLCVFERPHAPRLMSSMKEHRAPMGEDEAVRAILDPCVSVLGDLYNRGIYHGAIRPTNLYYNPGGSATAILGQCVSAPPSFGQPAMIEPIERAMAMPSGRGPGTVVDDIYALGATIAILALGHDPSSGMTDEQIIELKIDRGSYPAIVGNTRISSGLIEPLRGMLYDDPRQRWTLDDIRQWLAGRRLSPKQPQIARRAQRAFALGGQELWRPRSVAMSMRDNVVEAVKVIDNGELDRWLRRTLGDNGMANRVAEAVTTASSSGRGGSFEDRLVARVSMALDPGAPIRYKGNAMMPLGIGDALAYAVGEGQGPQEICEVITGQLPLFWLNCQTDAKPEHAGMIKQFDQYKTYLERSAYGYGPERVLYEMVGSMPCASDMLQEFYVTSSYELIRAFEVVGMKGEQRPSAPIDRHCAAFIAGRDRRVAEIMLNALGTGKDGDSGKVLATLNILTSIQRRFGPPQLPNLAGWFCDLMLPVIERFHNRNLRKRLTEEALGAARKGDLAELQALVDDPKTIRSDEEGFMEARRNFVLLAAEIARLKKEVANRSKLERGAGREAAAVISAVLAVIVIAGIVVVRATGMAGL
jgi:eukaryotic-like serine/threonine-protein kinase